MRRKRLKQGPFGFEQCPGAPETTAPDGAGRRSGAPLPAFPPDGNGRVRPRHKEIVGNKTDFRPLLGEGICEKI